MPRGDRTGPNNAGPMTGKGAGYCAGFAEPGFSNTGRGLGNRRGFGRRGGRHRHMAYAKTIQEGQRGGPGWLAPVSNEKQTMQTLETLKKEAARAQETLKKLQKRIAMAEESEEQEAPSKLPLTKTNRLVASIATDRCVDCGLCVDACVLDAIVMKKHVQVAADVCIGCGACVAECPNGAISLSKRR